MFWCQDSFHHSRGSAVISSVITSYYFVAKHFLNIIVTHKEQLYYITLRCIDTFCDMNTNIWVTSYFADIYCATNNSVSHTLYNLGNFIFYCVYFSSWWIQEASSTRTYQLNRSESPDSSWWRTCNRDISTF